MTDKMLDSFTKTVQQFLYKLIRLSVETKTRTDFRYPWRGVWSERVVDCMAYLLSIVGLGIKVPEIPEDALEYGEGNLLRTTQLMR